MKGWEKVAEGVYVQMMTEEEIQARKPEPKAKAKAKPPLDLEYANRKILVLRAMLRHGDINKKQFARIKAEIIARVVAL